MTETRLDPMEVVLALRVPVVHPDATQAKTVEDMQDFMLVSAFWSGELNEIRHHLRHEHDDLQVAWDTMSGWEMTQRGRTAESIQQAKRDYDPELATKIHGLRCRLRDLDTEIERLERDARQVSRAYSMLMGSA